MIAIHFRAPLVAAALSLLFSTEAAAQAAPAGPWAKAPTLSTACYSGTDPLVARLEAAKAAVNVDRDRQLAINKTIEDEYKSIEPMEMAARMQQWMMKNPQEAAKYMQGVQTVGADFNAQMPEINAAGQRFREEEAALINRYKAALDSAYAPGHARHQALKTKIGTPLEYPSVKDPATPKWAIDEENVIMGQLDQAYATTCPQWWGATGPVHAWLKTYRDWLTTKYIPFNVNMASQNAQTYAIMSTPSASWKTVATHDGVIKYLEAVERVFAERREKSRCAAGDCSHF